MHMKYLAPSVNSLVHKVVTGYAVHGYCFFYHGRVSERVPDEDLLEVDGRILSKFRCETSYRTRCRRKRAGIANCVYVRLKGRRDFVLLATHGLGSKSGDPHPFFETYGEKRNDRGEVVRGKQYGDLRTGRLRFHGYSIALRPEGMRPRRGTSVEASPRKGTLRGSVRIHMDEYRELKAFLVEEAKHRSHTYMVELFQSLPYDMYAPVRVQLHSILRACNRAREERGFEPVPKTVIPRRRRAVLPCEVPELCEEAPAGEVDLLEVA